MNNNIFLFVIRFLTNGFLTPKGKDEIIKYVSETSKLMIDNIKECNEVKGFFPKYLILKDNISFNFANEEFFDFKNKIEEALEQEELPPDIDIENGFPSLNDQIDICCIEHLYGENLFNGIKNFFPENFLEKEDLPLEFRNEEQGYIVFSISEKLPMYSWMAKNIAITIRSDAKPESLIRLIKEDDRKIYEFCFNLYPYFFVEYSKHNDCTGIPTIVMEAVREIVFLLREKFFKKEIIKIEEELELKKEMLKKTTKKEEEIKKEKARLKKMKQGYYSKGKIL